jgi:hypothetical protein
VLPPKHSCHLVAALCLKDIRLTYPATTPPNYGRPRNALRRTYVRDMLLGENHSCSYAERAAASAPQHRRSEHPLHKARMETSRLQIRAVLIAQLVPPLLLVVLATATATCRSAREGKLAREPLLHRVHAGQKEGQRDENSMQGGPSTTLSNDSVHTVTNLIIHVLLRALYCGPCREDIHAFGLFKQFIGEHSICVMPL